MKPKTTHSIISKLAFALLCTLAVGLVAVGCNYKRLATNTASNSNVLPTVSFSTLTKYSVQSGNAKIVLYENGEVAPAYSGALISSEISFLPDINGEFPNIQLWIDGYVENFRIVKTNTNKNDQNEPITGYVKYQGDAFYHVEFKNDSGKWTHNALRARLVVEGTESPKLRLVVHPNLSNSTAVYRSVMGKAISAHNSIWKSSAYSSAKSIQVRKLSFSVASYNSTDNNTSTSKFAHLEYNNDLFPFTIATKISSNSYSYLEGYFAEGRVVNVTRHQDNTIDYEVQSWTIGAPANNFVSLKAQNRVADNIQSSDNPAANGNGGINIVKSSESQNSSYWDSRIKGESEFYYEDNNPASTISVRACEQTHKKTVFANYVKVKNFSIAGRVFNADAVSVANPRLVGLANVNVFVYNSNNEKINSKCTTTNQNGYFIIDGLNKGDYLIFAYTGDGSEDIGDNTELNPAGAVYRFVSSFFEIDGNGYIKYIDGQKYVTLGSKTENKFGPCDTENVSVTASALPSDSNLDIEINFVDDSGEAINFSGARYEYVSGTTSNIEYYTANGEKCNSSHNHEQEGCVAYTTTTILVSVVPGKNKLVKNYSISANESQELICFGVVSQQTDKTIQVNTGSATMFAEYLCEKGIYAISADGNTITVKIDNGSSTTLTLTKTTASITVDDETVENVTIYIDSDTPEYICYFIDSIENEEFNINTLTNSVRANVYKSKMTGVDGSPIYLYYGLTESNYLLDDKNALFLTDPIGYNDGSADIFFPVDVFGNGILGSGSSNANSLIGTSILSGSSIKNSTKAAVVAFRSLIPAAIRDNYYYYVDPISQVADLKKAYFRVDNEEDIIDPSNLIILNNNHLNVVNNSVPSNKYFIDVGETYNIMSVGVAKNAQNNNYYYTLPIGIAEEGENITIKMVGNFKLSGGDFNSTTSLSDLCYTSGETVVAATGAYIYNHQNDANIAPFYYLFGEDQSALQNSNVIYFVDKLSRSNFDNTTENIPNIVCNVQYAYAFLAGENIADTSALPRSQVSAIYVLGKTIITADGFSSINALTPSGSTKETFKNYSAIISALNGSSFSVDYVGDGNTNKTADEDLLFGQEYNVFIDQTVSGSEVQGALGMTYLTGTPYPNPVFRFVVRHPVSTAKIALNVNLDDIYYVEALGTIAERETSDVIIDFSTFAFHEEGQNILNNKTIYNSKQTTIVTKNGLFEFSLPELNLIAGTTNYSLSFLSIPVEDLAVYYNDNKIYYTGGDSKIKAFCNSNKTENKGYVLNTSFSATIDNTTYTLSFNAANGKWTISWDNESRVLAASKAITSQQASTVYAAISNHTINESPAETSDFVVWMSSANELNQIAYYDIHTYDANELTTNGTIALSSDCSEPCIELLNLDEADILNPNNDYSEVAIGGTTSIYRIPLSVAKQFSGTTYGYFDATALNLSVAENTSDPYFHIESEAVVAIASPTIYVGESKEDGYETNIYYRFKEWQVYKRFNSQIIQKLGTISSSDNSQSIFYFYPEMLSTTGSNYTSSTTGYFLLLPIYERMYSVSVATYSTDGAMNIGGNIGVVANDYFYTYSETNNYLIRPLTNEYEIDELFKITYAVTINENQEETNDINYVIEVDGKFYLVNSNGTVIATISNINTPTTECTTTDGKTIKVAIHSSKITHSKGDAIYFERDGGNNEVIFVSGEGQLLACKRTGFIVTDKYGAKYTITIGEQSTNRYDDSEGFIYVNNQAIAQIVKLSSHGFKSSKDPNNKLYTTDKSIVDKLSPNTWLISRHSNVTLVASSSNGYRFDGWYLVAMDEETGKITKTNLNAFTQPDTNQDAISLPSNIYLLERDGNTSNYYKFELAYGTEENPFIGKYEIVKKSVQLSQIPEGAYILFEGRLYASLSIVSGNIINSLSAYNEGGKNYDNFIEYFYYEAEVKIVENSIDFENNYKVWHNLPDQSNCIITRILPYQTDGEGNATSWAVHYTNTSGLNRNLFSFANENGTSANGPSGALSVYQGTEIFHGTTATKENYFFLGQNTQNAATLIPTRVSTVNQTVDIVQIGYDNSLQPIYRIEIDGIQYAYGTESSTTESVLISNIENNTLVEGSIITLNYKTNQQESYVVQKDDYSNLYIVRYYLFYENGTYYDEVFAYNEDAQTYVEHNYATPVADRNNETVESGSSNWQSLNALQVPRVDFILSQVAALSTSGERMETTFQTNEKEADDQYSIEIDAFTLTFSNVQSDESNCVESATVTIVPTAGGTATEVGYSLNGKSIAYGKFVLRINNIFVEGEHLTIYAKADSYELSSTLIYEEDGIFYRNKIAGSFSVSGNTITINSLGKNMYVAASFQQYYHTFIQTDSDPSIGAAIEVTGVIYYNHNNLKGNEKAVATKGGIVISSTDVEKITLGSTNANFDELGLFGYKIGENQTATLSASDITKYYTSTAANISDTSLDFINKIKTTGINLSTTTIDEDGNSKTTFARALQKQYISNKWVDFDAGTSVIIVVRCSGGATLNTASFGLENIGNIEYLLCPTDETLSDSSITTYFYVIKVDFDGKNLNNTYLEAMQHPTNRSILLRNVSVRPAYLNSADSSYYFVKEINQKLDPLTGNIETKAPIFDQKIDQIEYIAKVTSGAVTNYYFVPTGTLSDLNALGISGAKWLNGQTTDRTPMEVSFYDWKDKTNITTTANIMADLLRGNSFTHTETLLKFDSDTSAYYYDANGNNLFDSGEKEMMSLVTYNSYINEYTTIHYIDMNGNENFDEADKLVVEINLNDKKAYFIDENRNNIYDIKLADENSTNKRSLKINTGRLGNFINLTSIEVFQFDFFALPIGFGEDVNNYDFITNPLSTINFGSEGTAEIWAAGGRTINGKQIRILGLDNPVENDKTIVSKHFDKYIATEDNYIQNNVLQPLTVVIDSLLTIKIPTDNFTYNDQTEGKTYIFAGWYQIKQTGTDENKKAIWSEPLYLGAEEYLTPVISDANTIVVALYKEVKSTKITLNTNSAMLEASIPLDIAGNSIVSAQTEEQITLGGLFDANSEFSIQISPTAGYRLSKITKIVNEAETDYLSFTGDLTKTKTLHFVKSLIGCTNDDNNYYLEYGQNYNVETIETTTLMVRIENFDKLASSEHIVTITSENGTKTYFSTSWLSITNDETNSHFTYSVNTTGALDSTNNHFKLYVVAPNGETTEITEEYTTSNCEILVALILDKDTNIVLNHSINEEVDNPTTNFVGWRKNGNIVENSDTSYIAPLFGSVVEYSATIEQILSLTINFEVSNATDAVASKLSEALYQILSLIYNGKRYSWDESNQQFIEIDEASTLVHEDVFNLFNTFYFNYNAALRLILEPTSTDPSFDIVVDENTTYHIVFVGFFNGAELNTDLIQNINLEKPTTITMKFAISSEFTYSTNTDIVQDPPTCELNVISGAEYLVGGRLAHSDENNTYSVTLAASNFSEDAIIESYTITVGSTTETVSITGEGIITYGNSTLSYSVNAQDNTIRISCTGDNETSISVVANLAIGFVIN